MNHIEVRRKVHSYLWDYALYGYDLNGYEFGLVYENAGKLRNELNKLLKQLDYFEGLEDGE